MNKKTQGLFLFISLSLAACSIENTVTHKSNSETQTVNQAVNIETYQTQNNEITTAEKHNDQVVAHTHENLTPTAKIEIKSFNPKRTARMTPSNATRIHNHVAYQARSKKSVLTHAQRLSGALNAHNVVRLKHGLQPLKWSQKLVKYSQQWADNLGSSSHCQIRHRGGIPTYGENLYRASSLRWSDGKREILPVTIKNVVKAWTDEEKWFNYNQNRCQPGKQCGHYTQIVWRDTTEVGCALKICPDKSQTWVCSYNPPGNFQGVRPY